MSLNQFFCILRARWVLAMSILLTTLVLALAWIALRPTYFTARAPVLVDVRQSDLAAGYAPGLVTSYMATQIDIIKSDRVADRVLQMLQGNLPDVLKQPRDGPADPANDKTRMIRELQTALEVKPARESNIINISWTGRGAAEAARVANAFAQAYVDTNLELKTSPAKRYAVWFEEQVKATRENLEAAQNKLSQYQQANGIVGTDEQIDFETARLNELSMQLTTVQGQTTESQSKRGLSRGDTVAEVIQSPLINGLKADISKLEGKLQESAATLGARHPTMQRMEAELASLRSRLNQETSRINTSIDTSFQAGKAREAELRRALAEQKGRVMAINKNRSQLGLLRRDVESAQRAFEDVSKSASQSRLQALTNQTNLMPLAAAVEPLDPVGPTAQQALLVAGIAGVLLALAGALLLELMNRRVRSIDDITMATQLPVLASLPASTPAFSARLPLASRRRLALSGRGAA